MTYRTMHFDAGNGKAACSRGGRSPALTDRVVCVGCALCERTLTFKTTSAAYWAKRNAFEAARDAEVKAAGFDPDMKLGDMSPEQVEAFAAWLPSKTVLT